jgi:hypothetical protein
LGLAWASGGWKFSRTSTSNAFYGGGLLNDPLVRWFDRHFVIVSYSGLVIPFALGYSLKGMDLAIKWFAYPIVA